MQFSTISRYFLVMAFAAFTLLACSSGGSGANGTLSVGLTDASTDQYKAVYVTVSEIQVNRAAEGEETEAGWISLSTPNTTYNLFALINGVRESLGIVELQSGHYTQMRLILGDTPDSSINILSEAHPFANYVIDLNDTVHDLKVPSGMQTGIKIVHGFDVNENSTTELVLDFDAGASVVIAGNSGQYLLKPTIHVLELTEGSIISGSTIQASDDSLLPGTVVSAQIFDSTASATQDRVSVEAATISNDDGNYSLFLSPGIYNLVFYKVGYAPRAVKITLTAGDTDSQDAALEASATGTLLVTSSISDNDSEAYATVDFREAYIIDEINEEIQLLTLNFTDGGTQSVTLPTGEVIAVSSSYGETTQSITTTINTDEETVLNITL